VSCRLRINGVDAAMLIALDVARSTAVID
jgi:hypothetical protein